MSVKPLTTDAPQVPLSTEKAMNATATELRGDIHYSYQYGIELDVEGDESLYGDIASKAEAIARQHKVHYTEDESAEFAFYVSGSRLSGEWTHGDYEGVLFYDTFFTADKTTEDTRDTIDDIIESVVDVYENYGSADASFDDFGFDLMADEPESIIHKLRDEREVSGEEFRSAISAMVSNIGLGTYTIQNNEMDFRMFSLFHYLLSNVSIS